MAEFPSLLDARIQAEIERLRRESASRDEHALAMKFLASVGSVKPHTFDVHDRFDRETTKFPTATPTGVHVINDFMSELGRDLWRRQYTIERDRFDEWIDFGGES